MKAYSSTAVLFSYLFLLFPHTLLAQYPEYPYPITNYDESYRGQFHFSPQGGWMNDVNGIWYYKGEYHLTFQHYPHGLAWAQMHWGHATGSDLLHWVQKPIALEPDVNVPGDCYSGSVVIDSANTSGFKTGSEDVFVAIYTATRRGTCLAYSNDKGATWQAYSGNPVAIGTTNESTRDPHVFWYAPTGRWVAVEWESNTTFYTSADLKNWTRQSIFSFGFECPDIFECAVDDGTTKKWVVMDAGGNYHIGSFNGTAFTPDPGGPWKMDLGPDFYASQTFFRKNFPDNRVIQMAWMRGNLGTSPWTHEASFPCEIKLKTFTDGVRITRNPIAEISSLYSSSLHWDAQTLGTGSNLLSAVRSKCFDLTAEFDLTNATATAVNFVLPNTTVTYNITNRALLGQSLLPVGNKVKIRLLVDWGELEVFGNDGRFSWTQNVAFPPNDSSVALSVNGNVDLAAMDFHAVNRIWPNTPLQPDFRTNLTGTWSTVSGTWNDVSTGKQGSGSGDVFCINSQTGTDFTFEGDITLLLGTAGALMFRASANAASGYCVNVDAAAGVVKLWAPGRGELARYATTIRVGVATYHLKVETSGSTIIVYFNNGTLPVINYTDANPILSGRFGLNVFNGTAVFQDVYVNGRPVKSMAAEAGKPLRFALDVITAAPVRIRYSVPPYGVSPVISLEIFDMHGRLVRTLVNRRVSSGLYTVNFDGRGATGKYFCRLQARSGRNAALLFEKVEAFACIPHKAAK